MRTGRRRQDDPGGRPRRRRTRSEPVRRPLRQAFLDRMYDDFERATRKAVLWLHRSVADVGAAGEQRARALRALDRPTLVLWGRTDPYLGVAHAERQRAAFARAEVRVLERSGHWPFADDPTAVAVALRSYLSRHAESGSRRDAVEAQPRLAA